MAPVEPEAVNSNTKPLALFSAHVAVVILLFSVIARFLAKSSNNLPPAYHTRRRDKRHHWHIITFSVLTALSFIITTYHAVLWRLASYSQWVSTKHVSSTNTLWSGWYGSAFGTDSWHLGRWTQDVDLRALVDDAVFGSSKALWWTYQEQIGIVTWSIFAGIEGRHRSLPTYITLCFVLLAQFAGLSVAQNLFFLTISVTHVPPPPPELLIPHSIVFLIPALWSNIVVLYSSVLRSHPLWPTISGVTYFIMPLLLALSAQPNALHKVSKHTNESAARSSYIPVFRLLSWTAFFMHGYRTFSAIVDNTTTQDREGSYYHYEILRHTGHYSDPNFKPNLVDQVLTVVSKILSIVHTNPIIGAVAWDVIFSTLSLCIWSFTRSLSPRTMLEYAGLLWTKAELDSVTTSISSTVSSATNSVRKRALSVGKRASEITESVKESLSSSTKEVAVTTPGHVEDTPTTTKRRGRPRKTDTLSKATAPDTPAPAKRRGRPPKRVSSDDGDDEREDKDYVAPPGARRVAAKLALEHDEFDDERESLRESEAGALAWGLWLLGGLGVTMSAVGGAEIAGR